MRYMAKTTADRLRAAVVRGAYTEVDELLVVYRHEVESVWQVLGSAQERATLAAEVIGLLRWSRQAMLAARAHAQSRLIRISDELSRQAAYSSQSRKVASAGQAILSPVGRSDLR